jgi:homogentisate 1,2-dioxygenase
MPVYHALGELPRKRHTIFRRKDDGLHHEQLMGNRGFVGPSSLLYHLRPPTRVREMSVFKELDWEKDPEPPLRLRHFFSHRLPAAGGAVLGRTPVLFNHDVCLLVAQPSEPEDFFYRNSMGDEVVYVTEGRGVLESSMGELPYRSGDYVVIPRGILHRFKPEGPSRFFIIESAGMVETPARYRNEYGQLLEHSPYHERDMRLPANLPVHDEKGAFRILVKKANKLCEVILDHHPFDVVGWDGYYYPWALNIEDFEPITGRLHQPPPVHQTFQADGFVVCSFVPRLYDYHPEAIPAPYNHSNVQSDEVIYYAKDEFMSRKGVEFGSITLHPDGLPHGPHPGKYEESIGKKETNELAVMVDTFRPLFVAKPALEVEDRDYIRSWLE